MSEAEKQEGQKTVVAFITGLLIGGLLVWVFSSTPETQVADTDSETESSLETSTVSGDESTVVSGAGDVVSTVSNVVAGDAKLSVGSQKAGDTVTLSDVGYPAKEGWIVVRDYVNGVGGKILGAARYNLDDGLLPTSVSLLRNTVSGSTYQVQFYTENGDRAFDTKSDVVVSGGETTFTAN